MCTVSKRQKDKNANILYFPCCLDGFEKIRLFTVVCAYSEFIVYAEENFVTALVPSDTACFASSPGSINLTAVWISLEDKVAFLLYVASLPASPAMRSKISLMKEFMMDIPFLLIPVSGCTCFSTL